MREFYESQDPEINYDNTIAYDNNWNNYKENSYRPGFSYHIGPKKWNEAARSSGVDCGGFVSRVVGYNGNIYKWNNLTDDNTARTTFSVVNGNYTYIDQNGFTYGNLDEYPGIFNDQADPSHVRELVWEFDDNQIILFIPGDIIWMRNAVGNARHIMIIERVGYQNNRREMDDENTYFIEATAWDERFMVQNRIYFERYENQNATFQHMHIIGRLKIDN